MPIDYSVFQEQVEGVMGQVLTNKAKKACIDYFNYYDEIKMGLDTGKIGVNIDMLFAAKYIPKLGRYNTWKGLAIICFIAAFIFLFINWQVASVIAAVSLLINLYGVNLKRNDAKQFAHELIVAVHKEPEKGMVNIFAQYLAGTISLYSSSHTAHWPSYSSCVLGGPANMIEGEEDESTTPEKKPEETILSIMKSFIDFANLGINSAKLQETDKFLIVLIYYLGALDFLTQKFKIESKEAFGLFRIAINKSLNLSQEETVGLSNAVAKAADEEFGMNIMRVGAESLQLFISQEDRLAPANKLKELLDN